MKVALSLIVIGLTIPGCLVGPNYREPLTITPEIWRETECNETVSIKDEYFFQWWKGFNDELLDELLCKASRYNYDLKSAIENIIQARDLYGIRAAALGPQINFDTVVTRTRNSQSLDGPFFFRPQFQNFFLVGFDANWEIDFFGRLERNRRAAIDSFQATVEDARTIQITILSEVARNYVFIRGMQKKVDLACQIVKVDVSQLALVEDRFQAGLASCIDVETSKSILDADNATLDNLESTLQQSIYAMGVLVGDLPETIADKLTTYGPIPYGIGKIPAGMPSELLRRRHDIKSAERQLASATELIGSAVAELFPKVTLTSTNLFGARSQSSNFGWASSNSNNLFDNVSKTWSVGPAISLPLLDWGQRIANIDLQTSKKNQAFFSYEKTVLTAFQEVEQALVAYFKEEERQYFLASQAISAKKNSLYTTSLLQAGLVDCSQAWEAQKKWLKAENELADSEQALTTNLIALYKALGGDWECFYSP